MVQELRRQLERRRCEAKNGAEPAEDGRRTRKDRPEPSLNRFFVDAVDEASAPESIADDLIDMAAALFPGQDFTA